MDNFEWGPALRVGQAKAHKTLTEETLARLRRDIVSGEFEAGQKVKSEDLKKRYQVGTSPIREALFQLVSEGLVRSDGQRGFRVAELRQEELLDITDWRARLECEALRRAIATGDMEWEARVVAAFHRLTRVEGESGLDPKDAADLWEDHHRSFHFALYSACGSPWLLRFCELLIQHGERYRRAYISYPRISSSITAEHKAIMDAAMAREGDRAADLLERHIRHAADLALAHATRRPALGTSLAKKRRVGGMESEQVLKSRAPAKR
ncbi:GntR family transcriptional regulator [Enterovirga aerilata]|uniref:FCD domain-containing protein n=1 Tax=Enterovirga aerilata TaxID=2730920 RepID=A0A849I5N5_9HYPH|nr:FCD domain-containing protein [Enterovirga sp. DB1703]NNM75176.1 FCD domain-containing protein [Enterovirga sp. DB1703]